MATNSAALSHGGMIWQQEPLRQRQWQPLLRFLCRRSHLGPPRSGRFSPAPTPDPDNSSRRRERRRRPRTVRGSITKRKRRRLGRQDAAEGATDIVSWGSNVWRRCRRQESDGESATGVGVSHTTAAAVLGMQGKVGGLAFLVSAPLVVRGSTFRTNQDAARAS